MDNFNIESMANWEATELTEEELKGVDGGAFRPLPAKDGFMVYHIQAGDSLSRIGNHYGVTVHQLLTWNPQIKNKSHIRAGAYLYIKM